MKPENLYLALFKLGNALINYCENYGVELDVEVLFLGSQSIFIKKSFS